MLANGRPELREKLREFRDRQRDKALAEKLEE
jgi:hypothetical protein